MWCEPIGEAKCGLGVGFPRIDFNFFPLSKGKSGWFAELRVRLHSHLVNLDLLVVSCSIRFGRLIGIICPLAGEGIAEMPFDSVFFAPLAHFFTVFPAFLEGKT